VHRQHVFGRQQEVLHREHGFLHFTGVQHAGDQHLLLGEIEITQPRELVPSRSGTHSKLAAR
jgi:hypothetical protein